MSKSKKITFNMINAMLPEIEEHEVVIDKDSGMTISVKSMLGFGEAMNFVRSIAAASFDGDGMYMPEVFDFVVAINAMMYYAGFDEPKDFEKAYHVLMCSNVYNMIMERVNKGQFNALVDAARALINHRCQEMIQANVIKMNELISEVERMAAESSEAAEVINSGDFQKTVESLIAGITAQNNDKAQEAQAEASTREETGAGNIVQLKRED